MTNTNPPQKARSRLRSQFVDVRKILKSLSRSIEPFQIEIIAKPQRIKKTK